MSAPRLSVDRERCIGAGMCAMTAPEVFDQDPDDGLVLLLHAEPPATHRAAAQMAAGVCPSGAITGGVFEDPAVDDERFLPQHGEVEGPAAAEAVVLRPAHQTDDP